MARVGTAARRSRTHARARAHPETKAHETGLACRHALVNHPAISTFMDLGPGSLF